VDDRDGSTGAARDERGSDPTALEAAPGLMRLWASAWLRTAGWTAQTAVRAGRRLGQAALSGEGAGTAAAELGDAVREGARRLFGLSEVDPFGIAGRRPRADEAESLRERGAALLERSAELDDQSGAHPAYDRILTQLAPDEARILRLLATEGAQAAVDVRTWRPFGIGSRVVGPGLSMIGPQAGCMNPWRVQAYLANLYRLGLIWFSREPIRDLGRYQVLEAQPDVIEAMREAGRASTVRRSIQLTPFGEHFCEFCLPLDTAELEAVAKAGEGTDAIT
jgi:Abortive infection alpha